MTDTKHLRKLAEAAEHFIGQPQIDFKKAANPTTILSLLDTIEAQRGLLERAREALNKGMTMGVRLGDFVGNHDKGGASGLGEIPRCDWILEMGGAVSHITKHLRQQEGDKK